MTGYSGTNKEKNALKNDVNMVIPFDSGRISHLEFLKRTKINRREN